MKELILHLETIQQLAVEKESENENFRLFLKEQDGEAIDKIVHRLNDQVTEKTDCTSCGNCCKSLLINVTTEEAGTLAAHLQTSAEAVKDKYLDVSPGGKMVISSIPCHFLQGTQCSIYEHRFEGCREFPHLDRPHFTRRLFGTMMYYGTCPIIFNVIELLKEELEFNTP